jgi:hypothetical protein
MGQKAFSVTAGAIFFTIALLHAVRLLYGWEAVIGGLEVPTWVSWLALVISAYLSYAGLSLGRRSRGPNSH